MSEKTIMIIEDDDELRELYKNSLKDAGLHVLSATNGADGLDRVKTLRPALVLLDLMMPQMNGFDVLKEIKNSDDLKSTKVLVLSSLGQESDIAYATKLGAEGYLIKHDINLKELVGKIKNELDKK